MTVGSMLKSSISSCRFVLCFVAGLAKYLIACADTGFVSGRVHNLYDGSVTNSFEC